MRRPEKLYHLRSGIVLISFSLFVLYMLSMPPRRFGLVYWVIAVILEGILIFIFWPFDPN